MKKVLCNESEPSLIKIAAMTGNTITNIHKSGKSYYCKLNGVTIKTSEARELMIKDVIFVNHAGYEIRI